MNKDLVLVSVGGIPLFVHYLAFVQNFTIFCPLFVLLVSFLSSFHQDISLGFSQKSQNKSWNQSGHKIFLINPATGQKMDNFRILRNLLFVHLLSWCRTLPILTFYNDIVCLDKSLTSSRHCSEHVFSACLR